MKKDILKVVLIGDGGVGKTSLRIQYIHRRFTNNYKATIGADFITKEIQLEDGKKVAMQIWDTAGQERFQSLGVAYYRGADACVIVYDVTNSESFKHVSNWLHEFIDKADLKDPSTYPFILIANKIDSQNERQVSKLEGRKMARKMREQSIMETPHFELINQQTKYDPDMKFRHSNSFNSSSSYSFISNSKGTDIKSYNDNLLAIHQRTSSFKRYNYLNQEMENQKSNENKRISQERRNYLSPGMSKLESGSSGGGYSRDEGGSREKKRIKKKKSYYYDDDDDDDEYTTDNDSDNDFDFDNFKIPYFEVSAKLGNNVDEAFNYIARTVQLPKFEFLIEGDTINWDESPKTNYCCFI